MVKIAIFPHEIVNHRFEMASEIRIDWCRNSRACLWTHSMAVIMLIDFLKNCAIRFACMLDTHLYTVLGYFSWL